MAPPTYSTKTPRSVAASHITHHTSSHITHHTSHITRPHLLRRRKRSRTLPRCRTLRRPPAHAASNHQNASVARTGRGPASSRWRSRSCRHRRRHHHHRRLRRRPSSRCHGLVLLVVMGGTTDFRKKTKRSKRMSAVCYAGVMYMVLDIDISYRTFFSLHPLAPFPRFPMRKMFTE